MNKLLSKPAKKQGLTDLEKSYKRIFLSTEGKVILEDLKKRLRQGQTLYRNNQSNGDLHFELGRQSVINDIQFILDKEAK